MDPCRLVSTDSLVKLQRLPQRCPCTHGFPLLCMLPRHSPWPPFHAPWHGCGPSAEQCQSAGEHNLQLSNNQLLATPRIMYYSCSRSIFLEAARILADPWPAYLTMAFPSLPTPSREALWTETHPLRPADRACYDDGELAGNSAGCSRPPWDDSPAEEFYESRSHIEAQFDKDGMSQAPADLRLCPCL